MAREFKLKDVSSLSISPGSKQEVEVEGIAEGKILLVHTDGEVRAIGARCTHYGAPLAKGVLTSSGRLTCPWHGACFNTRTGDIEDAPALDALPVFKVTERDGSVYITGNEDIIKSSRQKAPPQCSVAAPTPKMDRVIIVGGGSGSLGAVEGLREKGYTGAITIISREGYLPIDRPKLSKTLLTDPAKLASRDDSWLKDRSIDWISDEVTGVDFASRMVSIKTGDTFTYTKLILATGGIARSLPLEGVKLLENIFTLRTVDDAKAIVQALGNKGKKIVIIGSSFIGMELANALCSDNSVVVVGQFKTPLHNILGEQIGAMIQKSLEAKGVNFLMGVEISQAEPSESDPTKVGAVRLKDGLRLEADLVILGVGVSPATEFLKSNEILHLAPDGSIKTDENFQVEGLKGVYAVGDIATYPYHGPGGDGKLVRIEHWNVAQNSGRIAAAHIVNPAFSRDNFIPIFWSALGSQLRYCGNPAKGWDDVTIQGNLPESKFAAYYTKNDTVVAMASMGMDPVMAQSAELMRLGKMPNKSQLVEGMNILDIAI